VLFGVLFNGIVDVNLRHSELWDGGHATGFLAVASPAEFARPVECIEEADDRVTAHSFLDTLESGATAEEFFQSETLTVADDIVMRKDHQTLVE
jgi:hypothetical protein